MANVGEALFGVPSQTERIEKFSPQQMQLQNLLAQMGMQGLQQTPLDFGPIRQEAQRRFQTETIPGLLERLQGFGGEGGIRSSALGQQLGAAGTGLESQLAGMESQYNLSKISALLSMLGLGLEPQFEASRIAAQPGLVHSPAFGKSIGKAFEVGAPIAGAALGGIPGAIAGAIPKLLSLFGGSKTNTSTGPTMMASQPQKIQFPSQQFGAKNLYQATSAFPYGMPNINF